MPLKPRPPRPKTTLVIATTIVLAFYGCIGGAFGYAYRAFTAPGFVEVNNKVLDIIGSYDADLVQGSPHLLKLWGDDAADGITVNDKAIQHFWHRQRKNIKEFYYYIPPELINETPTRLRIRPAVRFSLRLRNNVASSEWGSIVLLSGNTQPPTSPVPLVVAGMVSLTLASCWIFLCRSRPRLNRSGIAATHFWSCLFVLFEFWVLGRIGTLLKVQFIFHPSSWALCVLFTLGTLQGVQIFTRRLSHLKRIYAQTAHPSTPYSVMSAIDYTRKHLFIMGEIIQRTPSRHFALAAAGLLMLSSLCLALNALLWANLLSILIFCSLVFACINKWRESRLAP